jgi:hypothetical protein
MKLASLKIQNADVRSLGQWLTLSLWEGHTGGAVLGCTADALEARGWELHKHNIQSDLGMSSADSAVCAVLATAVSRHGQEGQGLGYI